MIQIPFDRRVDALFLAIEQIMEQSAPDLDFESQEGLLRIELPNAPLLLSRQPAREEIWLACSAGGFHFHEQNGQWVTQDGQLLTALLTAMIEQHAGVIVSFESIY